MMPRFSVGPSGESSSPASHPAGAPPDEVPAGTLLAHPDAMRPGTAPAEPAGETSGEGARLDWAAVPRVNLLPVEIIDAQRFRRVQRVLAGVVALVVVLCGLATVWAQSAVGAAEEDLAAVRAETVDLQLTQARYAEVPKVSAELEAARTARARALGSDILWFRFLTDLAVNTPDGTALKTVSISMTGETSDAAGTEPLAAAGLGTVTVKGEAGRFTDVAAWLDEAGKVNGLAGTRLDSATLDETESAAAGKDKISYNGTAVVTTAALSHRYDQKAS